MWNEFASDPARCRAVAESIRQAVSDAREGQVITSLGDDVEEAEEGRVITALHRRYERQSGLVETKKKRALTEFGKPACEACGFDFRERYGERGEGFIECRHTRPVHTLRLGDKTRVSDLRLLCSNCHRMVHSRRPWLTMQELFAVLNPNSRRSKSRNVDPSSEGE